MRDILTGIAILLILAIVAAIAAPPFIDWNGQRSRIEVVLAETIGLPVRIDGDVSLRLLPTPSFTAGHVVLADRSGDLTLKAEKLSVELTLPALVRGEIKATSAEADGLDIIIDPAMIAMHDGTDIVVNADRLKNAGIDVLTIKSGRLLKREGESTKILADNIRAEIGASSLAGPITGSGSVELAGRTQAFRLSIPDVTREKLPLRFSIEDAAAATAIDFVGDFRFLANEERAAGSIAGALTASGSLAVPNSAGAFPVTWRLAGNATLTDADLGLTDLTIGLGDGKGAVTLAGTARIATGAEPRIAADLKTRQIDLDQLLGDGDPRLLPPTALVQRLRETASLLIANSQNGDVPATMPVPLDLRVAAAGVTLGGAMVSDLALHLGGTAQAPLLRALTAKLPGDGTLDLSTTDPVINGPELALVLPNGGRSWAWLIAKPDFVAIDRAIALRGRLIEDANGLLLNNATVTVDGAALQGSIALRQPAGADASSLITVNLATDTLDLDRLTARQGDPLDIELPARLDVDLGLSAKHLRFQGEIFGGLELVASSRGQDVFVKTLALEEFGQARLSANGSLNDDQTNLQIALSAEEISTFSALLNRLLPGSFAEAILRQSKVLSPANLKLSLTSSNRDETDAAFSFTLDGSVGGTTVAASGLVDRNDPTSTTTAGLKLTNPDANRLLSQVGLTPSQPIGGAGEITMDVRGSIGSGFDIDVGADALMSKARFNGRLSWPSPNFPLSGAISIQSVDLASIARASGVDEGFLPTGKTGTLQGRLMASNDRLLLSEMTAVIGSTDYKGEVSVDFARGGKVSGQLRTGSLDLSPLLGIPFGSWPERKTGELWAGGIFGPALPPALIGDLWIEAKELRLSDAIVIPDPRFVLRFDRDFLAFEHADGRFAGGRLKGDVFIRRSGAAVQLSGKFGVTDLDVSRIVPVGAEARINGTIEASSIATSPAGLVKAATGSGRISVKDLALSGIAPEALEETASLGLSLFNKSGVDGISAQFAEALSKGRLSLNNLPLELTLINGVLQVGPAQKQVGDVAVETRGRFDMTTLLLGGRINLASRSINSDLGIAPAASIEWSGPPGQLKRSIDLTQLTAAITDKAIAIEQEKARAFESDLRERSFFNRRYKADRWQNDLDADRAAREAAEEARIKAEEAARRAEEERLRLESEKQRSDAERLRLENERVALEAAAALDARTTRNELQRERRRGLALVALERRDALRRREAASRSTTRKKLQPEAAANQGAPLSLMPDQTAPLSIQP